MLAWFRIGLWLLMGALVVVVLGGYVSQWYRQQVSSNLDRMLSGGSDSTQPPPVAAVGPARSVTQQEQELLALDTGFVSDDEDAS